MTELLPPQELGLEAVGEALAGRMTVRDGRVRTVRRRFYDTFDGLLYGAGVTLAHSEGRLELISRESSEVREFVEDPRPAPRLFIRDIAPGPLRDALAPLIDVRVLLPLASLRGRERALDVLDAEGKTVVRMVFEAPEGLRARLRVAGVRGYDGELASVLDTLVDGLGFRVADEPLVDEAARAAGAPPAGVSSKIEVPLALDQPAAVAAAAVLRRLLEVSQANLEGTIADTDSEFLHDFRVSVRRTRSVQREFRPVFPASELERFRAGFRWLQQVTGDARDLDVYVLEFDDFAALVPEAMRGDLEPLRSVLVERRAAAHRETARALRSQRAVSLLAEWGEFLSGPVSGSEAGAGEIGALAGQRIRSVYRRMRRMGGAIDASSPAEEYHELRKKGKELRYLLELFGAPLYPEEVVRPVIKTLKTLQDVLGRHQDREIQVATLYSLAPSVDAHPRTLIAMGALVQRLREDELAARAEFAEPFSAFASKSQRDLVRETFA